MVGCNHPLGMVAAGTSKSITTMKKHSARLFVFPNAQTARLSSVLFCLLAAGFLSSPPDQAIAQTPGVLYTWPSTTSDWFKNFGAGSTSATLANSGGALQIT